MDNISLYNKETIIHSMLEMLSLFFESSQALSLTLFTWQMNGHAEPILIDLKYTFQLQINNKLITGIGKEQELVENVYFNNKIMNKNNIYDLSKAINKYMIVLMVDRETAKIFNFMSGITFDAYDWKETASRAFGENVVTEYFKIVFKKKLEKDLLENKFEYTKKEKI